MHTLHACICAYFAQMGRGRRSGGRLQIGHAWPSRADIHACTHVSKQRAGYSVDNPAVHARSQLSGFIGTHGIYTIIPTYWTYTLMGNWTWHFAYSCRTVQFHALHAFRFIHKSRQQQRLPTVNTRPRAKAHVAPALFCVLCGFCALCDFSVTPLLNVNDVMACQPSNRADLCGVWRVESVPVCALH